MTDEGDGHARPVAIAISLVTYDGIRWLDGCLGSLWAQDMSDWVLSVIDNASTDGTWERLKSLCGGRDHVSLERLDQNIGYAAAHNRAIRRTTAPFVMLLNQDTELDPGFLRHAVAALRSRPAVGAVQARIRRLTADGHRTTVLDSTGLVMDRGRRVIARSQGQRERPEHLRPGPVWGADGPVPVYRAAALGDAALPGRRGGVEVLDEDFFMYKEDVDLAWRLRLLGWSAWYEPAALAWHVRTVRAGRPVPRWIRIVSWRNHHLMQVKNESLGAFVRDAPWILAREALTLGHMVLTDAPRLRAIPAFLATLPGALRKRRVLWRRVRSRRAGPARVIDP